ncbi:hypothetical protein U1Q18_013839 [Sarracenia purpurea var. burkii]
MPAGHFAVVLQPLVVEECATRADLAASSTCLIVLQWIAAAAAAAIQKHYFVAPMIALMSLTCSADMVTLPAASPAVQVDDAAVIWSHLGPVLFVVDHELRKTLTAARIEAQLAVIRFAALLVGDDYIGYLMATMRNEYVVAGHSASTAAAAITADVVAGESPVVMIDIDSWAARHVH